MLDDEAAELEEKEQLETDLNQNPEVDDEVQNKTSVGVEKESYNIEKVKIGTVEYKIEVEKKERII